MVQTILPILQTVLTFGNICVMGFVFIKFLGKPHETLESRISVLEVDMKEVKQSLLQGNDRFREQNTTNEILLKSLLALIEFEIQYCLTENKPISKDLEKAKEELHEYLAKK